MLALAWKGAGACWPAIALAGDGDCWHMLQGRRALSMATPSTNSLHRTWLEHSSGMTFGTYTCARPIASGLQAKARAAAAAAERVSWASLPHVLLNLHLDNTCGFLQQFSVARRQFHLLSCRNLAK